MLAGTFSLAAEGPLACAGAIGPERGLDASNALGGLADSWMLCIGACSAGMVCRGVVSLSSPAAAAADDRVLAAAVSTASCKGGLSVAWASCRTAAAGEKVAAGGGLAELGGRGLG